MRWIITLALPLVLGCQRGGSCAQPDDDPTGHPARSIPPPTVIVVPIVGGGAAKPEPSEARDAEPVVVAPEPVAAVPEPAPKPMPEPVPEPVVVRRPATTDRRDELGPEADAAEITDAIDQALRPVPRAASAPDASAPDTTTPDTSAPDTSTPGVSTAEPPVEVEPIPWLEQYQDAYARRQIALSDVTTQLSNHDVGVYFEDHRKAGVELGTPHMVWLEGDEVQVVSPSIEALLVGRHNERWGSVATFTCDPLRYVCRSLDAAPIGAYFRFAPLGPARIVTLVGVMWFDLGESSAKTGARFAAFDRVVDARVDKLE